MELLDRANPQTTSLMRINSLLLSTAFLLLQGIALAEIRYVDPNNLTAAPPYISWTTAATNIQDAVDAAVAGDQILVTNGVYETGGQVVDGFLTNRVAVTKPLTIRSVNGPSVTVIRGHQVAGTTNGES